MDQFTGDGPVTKDGQLGRTIMTPDDVEVEPFRPSWDEKFDWVIQESLHHAPRIRFGDAFDASPFVASRRLHCLTYYCEWQAYLYLGPLFVLESICCLDGVH